MSDPTSAMPALDTIPVTMMPPAGHYGPAQDTGVSALMFDPPGLVTLAARRGKGEALAEAMREGFGLTLEDGPRLSRGDNLSAIGLAPGRWLILASEAGDLHARLAPLAAHAAITEQGDAFVGFALEGPRVGDLLARGVTLDLDASVFPPGTAATTNVAHLNVTLWREATNRYVMLAGRSHGVSVARFLIGAGAAFGLSFATRG
ncbi:sarcosine oxidase subunit gamma [Ancylobacter pratisalsi]|uniref:Sarcosine oxidase subunit gamma n=1 Tax=Ancylobacter pratisalsi TaxID=1745854 RepID=A0A6P1YNL1_9HYPH|nr:sarcosine oxidase subunit gamma [Ancylobacter pratisalsi]QIB34929.1 sarcosine oxidase subunit gamma [Ancylobacter pratisalsi]